MNVLEMEQPPDGLRGLSRSSSGPISLRKYSLAICLVEALVIIFFICLLLRVNYDHNNSHHHLLAPQLNGAKLTVNASNHWRTYSHGSASVRLLVDLAANCNQRKHDLKWAAKCHSREPSLCETLPILEKEKDQQATDEDPLVATVVTTSKSGLQLRTQQVALKRVVCGERVVAVGDGHLEGPGSDRCRFLTRLEVRPDRIHQKIIGWGGALTDSTINNILSLTMNGTKRLLDDYFGPDGLMFNMVRITIGGSDFSARFYTNDDIPVGDTDLNLKQFQLREEDTLYKIPLIRLVQDTYKLPRRSIKLFASMWSPPVWMKTNQHHNKGYLKGSITSQPIESLSLESAQLQDEAYYNALSELKVQFILAYQRRLINFWGLTVMNEPIFSVQPFLDFNTMIFPHEDYANYVSKYLGPKLRNNAQLRHIKLIAHDDNRRYLNNITTPILNQTRVRQYIDGISVHGYVDEAYNLMDTVHHLYNTKQEDPNFFVLPTELCSGHLPFMEKALVGNWHRGIHYGLDIIRSLQHSAAGWVDWNMALDTEGGAGWLGGRLDAPVIVDKGADSFYKSPMFYVLGQFSRYISPDSRRVETKLTNGIYDNHLETVTFLQPDNTTLSTVILNNNPYHIDLHFQIRSGPIDNEQENSNQTIYQISCPPDSITTVLYSKKLK